VRDKYKVLLMVWLLQFVNYLDRINLSIAAPTMMKELAFNTKQFGFVLAAFTFGYAIAQIPGGYLADRFGAKRLLIVSPILWSAFTGMTGLAASLIALIAVRVLFGMSEGLSNGPSFKFIGDYFPAEQRSAANGAYLSALALGPAFVAPLAVWFLGRFGWQGMFLWFTIPGLLMALLIWLVIPSKSPNQSRSHASVEADFAAAANAVPAEGATNLGGVIKRPVSWLIFFAYMAFNVAFWGFLGWMPSYLSMARHIDLKSLGFAASVPYMAGTVGLIVFGWLGSKVFYRHRCLLVATLYLLAGVSLYVTYNVSTADQSVIGLSAAAMCLYGGFGPVWSLVLDLTPQSARGAFSGFVNTGGQIGGFFAPIVVGYIVNETASFTGGFLFMIGALVIGALCFIALQASNRDWANRKLSPSAA